ncbi:MAG TPA: D-hexose-6-phosphate mutarotase [Tepidisphaeraceae bacterium]
MSISNPAPGPGGMPHILIDHPDASGEIFLQGAHLASWQPKGQRPVIYMSPLSKFAPGVAPRGGVPICFPWFGPKADDASAPAHGFARTREWQLIDSSQAADAATTHFRLTQGGVPSPHWQHPFTADLVLSLGKSLEMIFTVRNDGVEAFTFEAALHTYFAVSDVRTIVVGGLSGTDYIAKTSNYERRTDEAPVVTFTGETDRVYQNTDATCTIEDPAWNRQITVAKSGSRSTVVWNPFPAKAATFKDLGEANWPNFVCIETANAGENAVKLLAGQTHEMRVNINVLAHGAGADLKIQSGD